MGNRIQHIVVPQHAEYSVNLASAVGDQFMGWDPSIEAGQQNPLAAVRSARISRTKASCEVEAGRLVLAQRVSGNWFGR